MQGTTKAFFFTIRNLFAIGKIVMSPFTNTLRTKTYCCLAMVVFPLALSSSWAIAGTTPQVKQIYVKNDGVNLQWKTVYDVDFSWNFSSDMNRGPTLGIKGLQGLSSGEHISSRVWLCNVNYGTQEEHPSSAVFRIIDFIEENPNSPRPQNDGPASVSGKETIGYISLSALATVGLSIPNDPSQISFVYYNLYCGNETSCDDTDISSNAFIPLSGLDNSWRLVLDMDNQQDATPEVYINTKSQNIYKDEMLQVFFNTSVLPGMSDEYDLYFSISWGDETRYDNGVDLVSQRQPLFHNIVIPELFSWFEHQRLRYFFPDGVPQTDYILGLHLVDSEGNVVFDNFSSVSYFPEPSPFTASGSISNNSIWMQRSVNQQEISNSEKCTLGGIRTANFAATELDKATKRSMLALQMGSSFELEGRLKTLYQGVKGSYKLLKMGKKVCEHADNFEQLFESYDTNIESNLLTNEQASNIFAIEMITTALTMTEGGAILYSGFDPNDLVNGIREYYNNQNKQNRYISSIDNHTTFWIKFDQPFRWFRQATPAVKLKVTATPIFTYSSGYEGTVLKDIPKEFTTSITIAEKTTDLGEVDSDRTSFSNIDYMLKATLTRGLYLIKASTEDDEEVFRDTIHVVQEGQENTMIIDR